MWDQETLWRFESFYVGVRGHELAQRFRQGPGAKDVSFTYGEVTPESFRAVLAAAAPAPGSIFYDLGSGTGKAVFLAALSLELRKACGVELVPELCRAAQAILRAHRAELPAGCEISFLEKDFREVDLSDADVVFAHSAVFSDALMADLAAHCEAQLRPGARLILINKPLVTKGFQPLCRVWCQMDWGPSAAFIYERRGTLRQAQGERKVRRRRRSR